MGVSNFLYQENILRSGLYVQSVACAFVQAYVNMFVRI